MSGTAYGTVVLHSAPEAAAGGPLAVVQNGDMIELDVANRKLNLLVDQAEIEKRLKAWKPLPLPSGGYQKLYVETVMQANKGVDLDFLVGCRGHAVPRESH
jgi:dihydroxyacid dehydratase/phosphogluconate dehydratase